MGYVIADQLAGLLYDNEPFLDHQTCPRKISKPHRLMGLTQDVQNRTFFLQIGQRLHYQLGCIIQ